MNIAEEIQSVEVRLRLVSIS